MSFEVRRETNGRGRGREVVVAAYREECSGEGWVGGGWSRFLVTGCGGGRGHENVCFEILLCGEECRGEGERVGKGAGKEVSGVGLQMPLLNGENAEWGGLRGEGGRKTKGCV